MASVAFTSRTRHGGPPYSWFAEVASPAAGTWQAKLAATRATGCGTVTRDIAVRADAPPKPPGASRERLAAARRLELRNRKSRLRLDREAFRRAARRRRCRGPRCMSCCAIRSRNFLFNHLGLGEDEMNMVLRPDCADLPYFLRAYYAFKMGLPYGFSKCSRGGGGKAPHCVAWTNILNTASHTPVPERRPAARTPMRWLRSASRQAGERAGAAEQLGLAGILRQLSARTLADGVHSGSARTARERQQHRLLSGAAHAADAASRRRLCRSVRPRTDAGEAHRADDKERPALSSPSTASPTARSRASVSGAAISCSRRTRHSAARASSASARSCARRMAASAALQRGDRQESAIRAISPSSRRSSGSKTFTTAWTT